MTTSTLPITGMATPSLPSSRVAVIGFGPAGMCFCHHVEERRRKLLEQCSAYQPLANGSGTNGKHPQTIESSEAQIQAELAKLPTVTCFEQADGPGGLWRPDQTATPVQPDNDNDKIHSWTNGPKEAMEFFDYAFADHYGAETLVPSYLPRSAIYEYLLARVTRHAPDFCERYAQFRTKVLQVSIVSNDDDTNSKNGPLYSIRTQCVKLIKNPPITLIE